MVPATINQKLPVLSLVICHPAPPLLTILQVVCCLGDVEISCTTCNSDDMMSLDD